eukprot:GDKI01028020.1.p2 GENE.GDKI01028020.1~~GDKI01028020.1.p2  ORF type:complete len:158 (-),score=20.24 GDKI01028020.1:411-884(-)
MVANAYTNEDVHSYLYVYEALQRLVTPNGLLQQILALVFDPEGYPHYTERECAGPGKVRNYYFNVTNDSEKHYTDTQLSKLYTTWESVLGKDHPVAKTHTHLAKFRQPVRQVFATVFEGKYDRKMQLLDLALFRTATPQSKDDCILTFRNGRKGDNY